MQSDEETASNDAEHLVWVFQTHSGSFPSGVWSSREAAEVWIREVGACGILSAYVLDESAYDSNIRLGRLKLRTPRQLEPEFRWNFTTAVDHDHYPEALP